MDPKLKTITREMDELNKKESLSKDEEERFETLSNEAQEILDKIEAERVKDSRVKRLMNSKLNLMNL